MAEQGTDTTYVRLYNQQLILSLLEEQPYCCRDMARKLKLSCSGVKNIVDEMYARGLLTVYQSTSPKNVGRAPIYYELNANYGLVASFDFIHSVMAVSDVRYNCLYRAELGVKPSEEIAERDIEKYIRLLKEALTLPRLKGKRLLFICVASYGKLDIHSGRFLLVGNVPDMGLNIKNMFEGAFGVPALVNNDTYFSALAESVFGRLKNRMSNSLYVNVDQAVSSALIINGRILLGSHGIAGEIGYVRCYSEMFGRTMFLDDLVCVKSMLALAEEAGCPADDVAELYDRPETEAIVMHAADVFSDILKNFAYLLDCDAIVLSGNVVRLGERFLKRVNDRLAVFEAAGERPGAVTEGKNYNVKPFVHARAVYADVREDAVIIGCQKVGIDSALMNRPDYYEYDFREKFDRNRRIVW